MELGSIPDTGLQDEYLDRRVFRKAGSKDTPCSTCQNPQPLRSFAFSVPLTNDEPPPTIIISYSSDVGRAAGSAISLLPVPEKIWRRRRPTATAERPRTLFDDCDRVPARPATARAARTVNEFRRERSAVDMGVGYQDI